VQHSTPTLEEAFSRSHTGPAKGPWRRVIPGGSRVGLPWQISATSTSRYRFGGDLRGGTNRDGRRGLNGGATEGKSLSALGRRRFHGNSTPKKGSRGKLTAILASPYTDGRGPKQAIFRGFFRGKTPSQVPYLWGNVGKSAVFRGKTRIFAGAISDRFHGNSMAFGRPQPGLLSLPALWAKSCHSLLTTIPQLSQARRTS
jgi:hypothetical protein